MKSVSKNIIRENPRNLRENSSAKLLFRFLHKHNQNQNAHYFQYLINRLYRFRL